MANPPRNGPRRAHRWAVLCLAGTVLGGCTGLTQSTSVRSLPDPPTQHVHLTRSGVIPVTGSFHQEAHSIVGQLAFTNDCAAESRQLVRRQETTETHPNRALGVGLAVVGGVVTAVGAGLLVASGSANDEVSCGAGRAGDTCNSESSALATAGLSVLLSGLSFAIYGGYTLAQKPKLETKELPAETRIQLLANNVSCGTTATLEGLAVAVDLPDNGTWRGRTARDGSVRIDVSESIRLPEGATLNLVVDSAPAILSAIVSPGATLGTVRLAHVAASKKSVRSKQPRDPLATRW